MGSLLYLAHSFPITEYLKLVYLSMANSAAPLKPNVSWAQSKKVVFLTVNVPDIKDPEIKVEKDSLYLKGMAAADNKVYEVTMKFLKEIDPQTTKYNVKQRCIEFGLEKAEEGPFWERLLADKTKQHWLKIDFTKWRDEDDSDTEGGAEGGAPGGGGDLEEMMKNMGGLGGGMGGMDMSQMMAGMGGGDGQPNMDDLDGDDSDDEE